MNEVNYVIESLDCNILRLTLQCLKKGGTKYE